MKLLIKNAKVVCDTSSFNGKQVDVLIEDGIMTQIESKINSDSDTAVIEASGLMITKGLVDVGARLGEPGFEYLEDAQSLTKAAARGGYTHVAVMPNTKPVVDTAAMVDSISQLNVEGVQLHVIGAITKDLAGKQLAEMLDMNAHGVQLFSDDDQPIVHGGILLKALEYTTAAGATILTKSYDDYLSQGGQIHESLQSTTMGLTAIPSIAEEIGVARDLNILKYSGGKLHIHQLSTKEGVALIKKAKKEGVNVTCDVSASHLLFDESYTKGFDTTYKVNPPLRSSKDQKALLKGLEEGVIDMVVTGHRPHVIDAKQCEFDQAEFGMSLIETAVPALMDSGVSLEVLDRSNEAARTLLGLDGGFEVGDCADLTLVSNKPFQLRKNKSASKGVNSPHFDKNMTYSVVGTVLGDKYQINE